MMFPDTVSKLLAHYETRNFEYDLNERWWFGKMKARKANGKDVLNISTHYLVSLGVALRERATALHNAYHPLLLYLFVFECYMGHVPNSMDKTQCRVLSLSLLGLVHENNSPTTRIILTRWNAMAQRQRDGIIGKCLIQS